MVFSLQTCSASSCWCSRNSGKDPLADSHKALSDIIDVPTSTNAHYRQLIESTDNLYVKADRFMEKGNAYSVGLGKLGGREPNFHSDVDVIFFLKAKGYSASPT